MRYWAYLSYAHADERHARWLHRRIESFRVPAPLRGTRIEGMRVGDRLRPLFRDRDELSSAGDLKSSLEGALSASTALIVLCSPAAARSRWVDQEIETFVAAHGPKRVFPLIVEGEPNSGDQRECFPPSLRAGHGGLEPIAGDLRPHADGRRDAALKVIAGLLGVGFDVVKRREAQRRQRTAIGFAAAASLVAVVTTVMAVYAIQQRDIAELRRAQAEDLIGFMLGDLRTRLREVGRLDVLDAVGEKAEDYFAALPPAEINDHALEKQALALRQIGEVRLQQGQHEAAQRAFETSLAQLAELVSRRPADSDVLFERAQAEFWAGAAHYRALSLERAREYFVRYADSARALVEREPDRSDFRIEEAYALSNLGTLAIDQGDLDAADDAFRRSGAIFAALAEEDPDDPELRFESAASLSWRARVSEARFDWPAAVVLRRGAAEQHAEASAASNHPFHRHIEAEALAGLASAEFALGNVEAASSVTRSAIRRHGALAELDPDNLKWRSRWLWARGRQAVLAHFTGDDFESPDAAFAQLLEISASDPENRQWAEFAASTGLDLSVLRLLEGAPAQASEVLERTAPLVEAAFERAPDDSKTAGRFYRYAALAALIDGDTVAADRALAQLRDAPALARANAHLHALLVRIAGDPGRADTLAAAVAEAGFDAPDYRALQALATR